MMSIVQIINQFKQSDLSATSESLSKTIADNIFDNLKSSGLRDKDIVAISTELLGRLTSDLQERQKIIENSAVTKH